MSRDKTEEHLVYLNGSLVPRGEAKISIFDSAGREERLQINRVMDLLGIGPGKTVADIGAGSGWFTVRAARRVGPGGS